MKQMELLKEKKKKEKWSNEDISDLCLSLSMLIHAGVGGGEALALIAEDEELEWKRERLLWMADQADMGMPISYAFEESKCFPDYVVGLLTMGEQSGRMEEALAALADYYESRLHLERQIRSALLYPAMLLGIMILVVGVLLVKVMPVFDQVYGQLGSQLTGVAAGLLAVGNFLGKMMPLVILLLAVLAALLLVFFLSEDVRSKVLRAWRLRQKDGGVSQKINMARVAQSLSMGMSSGLMIEEALTLSASLLERDSAPWKRCLDCAEALNSGQPLAQSLREHKVFPQAECRLLEVGMRGGAGDSAMEEIARRLSLDSEEALEKLVSKIEPTLIIITSVVIGLILVSVMLPLAQIMTTIG